MCGCTSSHLAPGRKMLSMLHGVAASAPEPPRTPSSKASLVAVRGDYQHLVIMHIPKTGVDSFCKELIKEGALNELTTHCSGGGALERVAEVCLKQLMPGPKLSFFREPRGHVLSQYMQCRFDDNWPWPDVPGTGKGDGCHDGGKFSEACFNQWLDDSAMLGANRGYHPWNMESRYLVCNSTDSTGSHSLLSEAMRVPAHADVIAALDSLSMVGITDLYDESWCLIQHELTGALPEDCTCDTIGKPSIGKPGSQLSRTWHGGEIRSTHGIPHVPPSDLSASTLAKVDRATAMDQQAYAYAAARVLRELCSVQRQTGTTLVCLGRVKALISASLHINGMADGVADAIAGCEPGELTCPGHPNVLRSSKACPTVGPQATWSGWRRTPSSGGVLGEQVGAPEVLQEAGPSSVAKDEREVAREGHAVRTSTS